jgi:hypothetical protein
VEQVGREKKQTRAESKRAKENCIFHKTKRRETESKKKEFLSEISRKVIRKKK